MAVKYTYSSPTVDECIDSWEEASVFSYLDFQVQLAEEDREKTAFVYHRGSYRYNLSPFGLCNAHATFQCTLYILLSPYQWRSCLSSLGDFVILSRNMEEHIHHVEDLDILY